MDLRFSASMIRAGLGPPAYATHRAMDPLSDHEIRSELLDILTRDFGVDALDDQEQLQIESGGGPTHGGSRWACGQAEAAPIIVEELPLRGGYVRADLAVLGPRTLHIYEIKSDRDRLDRLEEQMRLYNEVADFVTLVVGWPHAITAMRRTPSWWEIWLAERTPNGRVHFVPLRELGTNSSVEGRSVAALLSRGAALECLATVNRAAGVRSKPRDVLYERIGQLLDQGPEMAPMDLARLRQCVHSYWSRREKRAALTW